MVYTVWVSVECLVERHSPLEPHSSSPLSLPAHSPTVAAVASTQQLWTRRPFADLVVNVLCSRNDCTLSLFVAASGEHSCSLPEVVRCFRWDSLPLHVLPQRRSRTLAMLGSRSREALIVDQDVDGWVPHLRPQVMTPDPDPRRRRWSLIALLLKICRVLDSASIPGMPPLGSVDGVHHAEHAACLIARAQADLLCGLPPLTIVSSPEYPGPSTSDSSCITGESVRRAELLSRLESLGATTYDPSISIRDPGEQGDAHQPPSAVEVTETWIDAVVACQSELLPVCAAETWLAPVLRRCEDPRPSECGLPPSPCSSGDGAAESSWIVLLLLLLLAPSSDVVGICDGVTVSQVRDAAAQFIDDFWDDAALTPRLGDDPAPMNAFSLMQQQCLEAMFVAPAESGLFPDRTDDTDCSRSGRGDRRRWFRRTSRGMARGPVQLSDDALRLLVQRLREQIRDIPAALPPPSPVAVVAAAAAASSSPGDAEGVRPLATAVRSVVAANSTPFSGATETAAPALPTSRFSDVVERVLRNAKRSRWEKAVDAVLLSDMDPPFRDEYRLVGKPQPQFKTCHLPLFAYGIKVWFASTEKIQKLIWKLFSFKSQSSPTEILSENILETTRVSFRKEKVTCSSENGGARGDVVVERVWCDFDFEFAEEADGFAQNLFVGWVGPANKWQDRKERILIIPHGVTLEPLPADR